MIEGRWLLTCALADVERAAGCNQRNIAMHHIGT